MGLLLRLLGRSCVELNGLKINFALRKSECLVYYIALSGTVSREHLETVFWVDKDHIQASANLRNALYLIRTAIPDNIISDRRSVSIVNFTTDIDMLSELKDPSTALPACIFEEPLNDLDVPESDDFFEWISLQRKTIRKKIISMLNDRIAICYEKKNSYIEELESSLEALLRFEPYDEDYLLELMDVYKNTGRITKAINLYNLYTAEIKNSLGIAPSQRADEFFKKLLLSQAGSNMPDIGEDKEKFWCRKKELTGLLDVLINGSEQKNLIYIYGEPGIGKTTLLNKAASVLSPKDSTILMSRSYEIGEEYPYASWNSIITQIGSDMEEKRIYPASSIRAVLSGIFPGFLKDKKFNYNVDVTAMTEKNPIVLSQMLEDIMYSLYSDKKLILIFEDIHWFDTESTQLLTAFLEQASICATVIITGRTESSKSVLSILDNLKSQKKWKIVQMPLFPFEDAEILEICRNSLPKEILLDRGRDYFIRESEGIPLLLFELFRAISENPKSYCASGLGELIMCRIGTLSAIQRDILNAMSVLAVYVEPARIAQVTGHSMADIIPAVEELISKNLLTETIEEGRAVWGFVHQKVNECVYNSISLFKRQELHRHAANILSLDYSPHKWSPKLSYMLRHHYIKSGQKAEELKQFLQELIFDITLNHDLFPVVTDKIFLSCSAPFSDRDDSEKKIEQAMSILEEIGTLSSIDSKARARLEASCFELAGGYHVSWGEYDKGRVYIDKAMRLASEHGFYDVRLYCLKHISYMYMQTENAEKLMQTAREIIRAARDTDDTHYLATAVRMIGVSYIAMKKYDLAEKTFRHSIKIFENLKMTGRSYTLGILVAMCYIGEIYHLRQDMKTALSYFYYCVNTCESMGLYWGRSYFHTHLASLAFDMEDWPLVYEHIDKAVLLFEECRGGRSGSMLYSIKAIADALRGRTASSILAAEHAEIFLKAVARKEWLATQYLAKAHIVSLMKKKDREKYKDSILAPLSAAFWAEKSSQLFRDCQMEIRADKIKNNPKFIEQH